MNAFPMYERQQHLGIRQPSAASWPLGFPTSPSKVYDIRWNMGHFGHDSQKPERGWTNNRHFQRLNLGPWKRGNAPKPKAVTVKKTISKTTGKPCYTGTPALKATQPRPHLVWCSMSNSSLLLFQIVHPTSGSTFFPLMDLLSGLTLKALLTMFEIYYPIWLGEVREWK